MKNHKTAVLLTCYNRKAKTLACLASFFEADFPEHIHFDIFLTDDGSSDGTAQAVTNRYPTVKIINGDGSLFWSGGMRLAWTTAIKHNKYDSFLLLNDDVVLKKDFFSNLMKAESMALKETNRKGIYSGATVENESDEVSYGSSKIRINHFIVRFDMLVPKDIPQRCEITNANILWVDNSVVYEIGILDEKYTHGIADYDYSLKAHKRGIPVYLAPNICGVCSYDHGNSWKSSSVPLKERIAYMKSPKGLAYNEYLYYIKRHFPLFLPYSFVMLWAKTLFPSLWDNYKNKTEAI